VTWDRSDQTATGYEIYRDGTRIATTAVSGDPWDDLSYVDAPVAPSSTYRYQVRAVSPAGEGDLSAPFSTHVRGAADVGSGRVFRVDAYSGTDFQRATAAISAARAAGGGVVRFGSRTYAFDQTLVVAGDDIVLQGAGIGQTFIQPGFAGATGACEAPMPLIVVRGQRTRLSASPVTPVGIGDRTIVFDTPPGVSPGQVLIFDESQPQVSPYVQAANGVTQDPGTGHDDRYRWDANEVVAMSGNTVTFRYPFSQPFTTAVKPQLITSGYRDGIERLTLQGRSSNESTYFQLLQLDQVASFAGVDVRGRWANRNYVQANGYGVDLVDFQGEDGGPLSYDRAPCKYKLTIFRAANVRVLGSTFGDPANDFNQSYIAIQKAQRVLVRACRFYPTRTYALDEHGGGSRHLIFENNLIAAGPSARWGGVLLGNDAFGFSGPVMVRNNLFLNGYRDLWIQENSYEVRFVGNRSQGNSYRVVDGYGWAGPNTATDLYGSIRLRVADNIISGAAGDGIALGAAASPWYPYLGVRDVIIARNVIQTTGTPVCFLGQPGSNARLQVFGNTQTGAAPSPACSSEGITTTPFIVPWTSPTFAWETYDTGV
jgi:hypothetical protein